METLRVSSKSRPNSVAGAIAALLRTKGEVEVQAIGPQAVNQAVKAIAIARGYIAPDNLDLVVKPAFVKLELENEERTALKFSIKAHPWKLEGRDARFRRWPSSSRWIGEGGPSFSWTAP